jgi:hypothetical protein
MHALWQDDAGGSHRGAALRIVGNIFAFSAYKKQSRGKRIP